MPNRFRSVRAKLTALVALTAVASLAAVGVLSWVMQRQLLDRVDDRVPEAARGFETELDDDLRDLEAIARELASRDSIVRALKANDAKAGRAAMKLLQKAHPDILVLLFDAKGALVAKVGVARPVESPCASSVCCSPSDGGFAACSMIAGTACDARPIDRSPSGRMPVRK